MFTIIHKSITKSTFVLLMHLCQVNKSLNFNYQSPCHFINPVLVINYNLIDYSLTHCSSISFSSAFISSRYFCTLSKDWFKVLLMSFAFPEINAIFESLLPSDITILVPSKHVNCKFHTKKRKKKTLSISIKNSSSNKNRNPQVLHSCEVHKFHWWVKHLCFPSI